MCVCVVLFDICSNYKLKRSLEVKTIWNRLDEFFENIFLLFRNISLNSNILSPRMFSVYHCRTINNDQLTFDKFDSVSIEQKQMKRLEHRNAKSLKCTQTLFYVSPAVCVCTSDNTRRVYNFLFHIIN